MNESSLRALLEKASQDPTVRKELEKILGEASLSPSESAADLPISDEDLALLSGGTGAPVVPDDHLRNFVRNPKVLEALQRFFAPR